MRYSNNITYENEKFRLISFLLNLIASIQSVCYILGQIAYLYYNCYLFMFFNKYDF